VKNHLQITRKLNKHGGKIKDQILELLQLFNSYFVETVEKLEDQNRGTHVTYNMANLKTDTCPQTILINPVSEN
jgi:hypothetical protein